jgi:hypothetical protein
MRDPLLAAPDKILPGASLKQCSQMDCRYMQHFANSEIVSSMRSDHQASAAFDAKLYSSMQYQG